MDNNKSLINFLLLKIASSKVWASFPRTDCIFSQISAYFEGWRNLYISWKIDCIQFSQFKAKNYFSHFRLKIWTINENLSFFFFTKICYFFMQVFFFIICWSANLTMKDKKPNLSTFNDTNLEALILALMLKKLKNISHKWKFEQFL